MRELAEISNSENVHNERVLLSKCWSHLLLCFCAGFKQCELSNTAGDIVNQKYDGQELFVDSDDEDGAV